MNYGDDKRRLMSAATTMRPLGYAGTGPARSFALLDVAGAMPASRRLGFGAVAPVTGPTVLLQRPSKGRAARRATFITDCTRS